MRATLPDTLEAGRIAKGFYGSDRSFGPVGAFRLAGPCGAELLIMCGDSKLAVSENWEHVSVSTQRRCPNWREMCFVKELFWDDADTVLQFHPPKAKNINNHPYTLHLWRPPGGKYVMPPEALV